MMGRCASSSDGSRAPADLHKRRPACRLRRLFFAAATALATGCVAPPTPEPAVPAGWQIDNHDHRKLLVVDGVIAFTGGINISRVHASSSFSRKHMQPAADSRIGRSELYIALLLAIAHARQRVWLAYGYFVPDERLLHALEQAARRGVDVRLVLPGVSDFWAPFQAGRARYGELLAAGVRIFERRDALLHAKTAAVDSIWTSVGSTKLDWRSFVGNYEADLIVFDRGFAHRLEQLFELDEAASHELSLTEWQRRGFASRFKEWLARCWERLL